MFCSKCGAQIADGSSFCPKCGASAMAGNAQNQTQIGGWQPQAQPVRGPMDVPKKKKSKKLPIILGIIAAIVFVIIIASGGGDEIDYKATARSYTPFAKSQGLPYTCGEVFDKYIPDAKWSVRKANDTSSYVDISGTVKGTGKKLKVTIKVSEDDKDSDLVSFSLVSATVDGMELSDKEAIATFLLLLFVAYDEKYEDLPDLDELLGQMDYGTISDGSAYQGDSDSISGKTEIGKTKSCDNDFGNMEVTLDSIEFVDAVEDEWAEGGYRTPDNGRVFLRANITVSNIGTKDGMLLTGGSTIIYAGKYEFSCSYEKGEIALNIPTLSEPREGALIFEVPLEVMESDNALTLDIGRWAGKDEGIISFVLR